MLLKAIQSNDTISDLLHLTGGLDRDVNDALLSYTNYKVLSVKHTCIFNDLVVHCRENGIM